jgi:hypothetical protein
MKGAFLILIAIAVALGGYFTYFHCATSSTRAMLSGPEGEMEWLRQEYHLSDAQYASIRQMHREYAPKCDAMCGRIAQANERLEQLIAANKTFTPEIEAAMKECLSVQSECRRALLEHIYAVSSQMSPDDGSRYLKMMGTRMIEPGIGHETVISQSSK